MVPPHESLGDVARSMIRGAAGAVLDAEAAALADEPDGVHALRTRVRRLRSILSLLRDHLDDPRSARLRVQLREWGGQLGTVRDAEVLAAEAATALADADIDKAADADIWIGAGSVRGTYDDLRVIDDRFSAFRALRRQAVFAEDRRVNAAGGNALFELGAVRPDLVLADLFKILYPDDAQDIDFTFYGPVGSAEKGG